RRACWAASRTGSGRSRRALSSSRAGRASRCRRPARIRFLRPSSRVSSEGCLFRLQYIVESLLDHRSVNLHPVEGILLAGREVAQPKRLAVVFDGLVPPAVFLEKARERGVVGSERGVERDGELLMPEGHPRVLLSAAFGHRLGRG